MGEAGLAGARPGAATDEATQPCGITNKKSASRHAAPASSVGQELGQLGPSPCQLDDGRNV